MSSPYGSADEDEYCPDCGEAECDGECCGDNSDPYGRGGGNEDYSDSGSDPDEHEAEVGPEDEDEEDEAITTEGPLYELGGRLRGVDQTASLSWSAPTRFLPAKPVMHVQGLGPVTFPLDSASAERLSAMCGLAPYGDGSATHVDMAVRDT